MEFFQYFMEFLKSIRNFEFFKLAKFKKHGPQPKTRNATIYLYRGITFLGLFPRKKFFAIFIIWSIFINGVATFYMPFAFCLSFWMKLDSFTPTELLTSLQIAVNCFGCSGKLIVFYFLYKKLLKGHEYMDILDLRIKGPEEQERIRKIVAFCNRMHLMYMILYFTYASSTFLPAVLSGRPPYQIYNPFLDWTKKPAYFYMQSLIEYLMIDVHCYQEAVLDSYPSIYIAIIRTHLKILADRISALGNDSKLSNDERYEALVQCILDHKNILKLYNEFAPVVSGTMFIQFMIIGVILGIAIVNIFIYADLLAAIGSVFFVLSVLCATFPCSFLANSLVDDSENLPLAIFHSKWFNEDPRFKRTVLIFLHNTQKTMVLTAMKIFPITLNSNINVVKFAFSVYTMIKQMAIEPK